MSRDSDSTDSSSVLPSVGSDSQILVVNMNNITKLSSINYITWSLQVSMFLQGHDLDKFISPSAIPPPATILGESGSLVSNPAHVCWTRQDKLIFVAILGSLSIPLQPLISTAKTSLEAWEILATTFSRPSRGHIKQIKEQLRTSSKGKQSISEYMQVMKTKSDQLALLGKPLDHEDLLEFILNGLDDDYRVIVDQINGRDVPPTFAELHEKLVNREASVLSSPSSASFPVTANVVFNRGRGSYRGNQRGRGGFSNNGTSRGKFIGKCQICNFSGHSALQCYRLKNFTSHQDSLSQPSQPRVNALTSSSSDTPSWLLDSGASHHVTSDLSNLNLYSKFEGREGVTLGDGTELDITHTGSVSLPTHSRNLKLLNVLRVPHFEKNLVSISRLCTDNMVSVLFDPWHYQVKDLRTGALLKTGKTSEGLYELSGLGSPSSKVQALSTVKAKVLDWHSRLGHPSADILKRILLPLKIPFSVDKSVLCHSCSLNKSHQLPFGQTSISSTKPLEFVFTDVWTSPLHSFDGFKYYLVLVDHFTRYVWFFPLKFKSQVADTFKRFKSLVENKFQTNIVTLFSDNGGEFIALASFLSSHGISHLTSPPHTPQHNGLAERRHRHIVETGLALMTASKMPLKYWTFAFSTAVYLINRLPSSALQFEVPYTKLFGEPPNYDKLRVFGCLAYPWLRPYTAHKLDSRSKACVFMGYSNSQSAYLCLDPLTSRIYASRHVQFCETTFPFSKEVTSSLTSSCAEEHVMSDCPSVRFLTPATSHTNVSSGPPPAPPSPPVSQPVSPAPVPVRSVISSGTVSPTAVTSSPSSVASIVRQLEQAATASPAPLKSHAMKTRQQSGIVKPNKKYGLLTIAVADDGETEPYSHVQALKHKKWRDSMSLELDAQFRNQTWELVPMKKGINVVGCRWVYRIKRKSDGSIDKFKSRLVAKGFTQRPGIDYFDTFSPVVKPTTIRTVLSVAVSRQWDLRQLDVNNAFLQGRLEEEVYMSQPPGFIDKDKPHYVCKLHKAIYGLKQAPRAWYTALKDFLLANGFRNSVADTSLFILQSGGISLYLLVYVDDIVITGSSSSHVDKFVDLLGKRFSIKDLGQLDYFLGLEVHRDATGLLLTQTKYINDLLFKTKMVNTKSVLTPMNSRVALSISDGISLQEEETAYRMIIGSLQYLLLTRPDIAFSVNRLSQFMHKPTTAHMNAAKMVLKYLAGTPTVGIRFRASSPCHLIKAFSDADWAGNKDDYTSTGAHLVYLGDNLVSWSSKKQKTVARSSTEAEYKSVATTASEVQWVQSLLQELGIAVSSAPTIFCDNIGATYLCSNPVFHSRMKHVAVDYHYIRDLVQTEKLKVSHILAQDQLADALTKPLGRSVFQPLCVKIGLASLT